MRLKEFITQLLGTNSPYEHEKLLSNFLATNRTLIEKFGITDFDIVELLDLAAARTEKKSQQGRVAATFIAKKYKGKIFKFPKFFEHFKGFGNCAVCNCIITKGSPTFFISNGEKKVYCPKSECFPAEFSDKMTFDKQFCLWQGKQNHKIY